MREKPFKTYPEQIEILESRNLKITDTKNAEYVIMNSSYYGLINGYKDLFILKKTTPEEEDDFGGNNFNDIKDLYDFDNDLRSVLYKYLLKIENTLKTSLSYHVSENIGYLQSEYLNPTKYRSGKELNKKTDDEEQNQGKQYSREVTLSIISEKITEKTTKPIQFYIKEYNNVPPWIVVNALTMGNLVNWYEILKPEIKEKMVDVFLITSQIENDIDYKDILTNSIKNAHYFRNITAHGSRVYCSKSNFIIKEDSLRAYIGNNLNWNYKYHIKHGGLFNILLEITILLSKRTTIKSRFIKEIEDVFLEYELKSPAFYNKMMKQIHMPFNFTNILKSIGNPIACKVIEK